MTFPPSHAPTLVALALALLAAPPPGPTPTMPPESLRPGQHAVVRTVFAGTLIESFDAEIVGVLTGGRTEGATIIARATTERVVKSGIAQGMSGSPVYVDGKLVGALSSSWGFAREPIFGVTPIGEMLDVLDHGDGRPDDGSAGPTGVERAGSASATSDVDNGVPTAGDRPTFRGLSWDDGGEGASFDPSPSAERPIASGEGGFARLALPLACGGLQPQALAYAQRALAPFGFTAVPGGRSVPAETGPDAASLEPGSAVAVEVLRGDLQLSAIGTLTWRDGDRVLIFGHPFFQSGDVRMPLASAEITTIVANDQFSFKLGSRAREVGAATQDRRAAVAGRLGVRAHMLPLRVAIRGFSNTPQTYAFESIEDRGLAPTMVALAALNSILEAGGSGAGQTLTWTVRMFRRGAAPLELSDVVVSDNPTADMAGAISAPLRFLYNNPFRAPKLDSLSIEIASEPGRRLWTLRGARVLDAAVRPGQRARVECELERWRGGRETRVLDVDVPEELPDGRYTLWVGGGAELSRYEASRLPGRYRAGSLDEAWRRLGVTRASDGLYVSLFARAPEVTREGRDYPELPTSALSVLASDQSAIDRSRRGDLARMDERKITLDGTVRGEFGLNLVVDAHAPQATR